MLTTVSSPSSAYVPLADGCRLALHRFDGPLRPFLLVHDIDADADSWLDVALRLAVAGHAVLAVDLRGHGDSDPVAPPATGCADSAADDLAQLLRLHGLIGRRAPIAAGHGWGANVVLSLAARRRAAAAVACIDGGFWRHSPVEGHPRAWLPLLDVPVLLGAALGDDAAPDGVLRHAAARVGMAEAFGLLPGPDTRVSWYADCGHDVPEDAPGRLADDLLALAGRTEPDVNVG